MMNRSEWIKKCNHWKEIWPVYQEMHSDDTNGIDIYEVLETISVNLSSTDIVMADAGSPSYACPTNLKAKAPNQFVFNPSQADMGWAVPASVGVSLAAPDRSVIVVVGDGSFYSNVQELAVLKHHNLPIRLMVLNNDGYLSIRNTQRKYHGNRIWGVDSNSGLTFPSLRKIADAFDIGYEYIDSTADLRARMSDLMHVMEPGIIEIDCKKDQEILPAQAFKITSTGDRMQAPLHDMAPFMTDDEMKKEWPGL